MKKTIVVLSICLLIYSCSSGDNENNQNVVIPTFTQGPNLTDIDGNIYQSVTNCTQTWMQSNLNVSHYRNGNIIPQVTDENQWDNLTTGAWRYHSNNTVNGVIYGKLYNWYAINDPRGIAPQGWHIPTLNEYNIFINCLGGESIAGGAMKEVGTIHWMSPNAGATNSSGFTGLPGGARFTLQPDVNINKVGGWWSMTPFNTDNSYLMWITAFRPIAEITASGNKAGFSVRCIKD